MAKANVNRERKRKRFEECVFDSSPPLPEKFVGVSHRRFRFFSAFVCSSRFFPREVRGRIRSRTNHSGKRFTCNALFGMGVPELVIIAGVASLVFGPKKLPEVVRSIGKTVKSFQQTKAFDVAKAGKN
ncbi:sec-independent protein translocase protein TATA, chloroplastic [Senna tora]|uniref:Sec-independent protein translocase protein TATA, chloroplastic n=1 Tax=Senna tora TaxID=362788 RepID=A0A834SHL0_9FABA|nr:sec-independent protein translocase protein TATA, chloroplastic [Senna tora]